MTDLIIGLIFTTVLVLVGALLVNHAKKSREAMLEEMDRLEKLEEEKLKAEAEAKKAQQEKPKPKRRSRAKKEPKFNPNAVDRDKDGIIQEGTKFERPVEKKNEVPKKAPARRGRPKKANGQKETKANGSKK